MNILWLSWKDSAHPQAGGAESIKRELVKRLVTDGHDVIQVCSKFKNGLNQTCENGSKIIRLGNKFTLYCKAYLYYKKHLLGWPDLVIDECNTIPFFASFYVREPVIMFFHQLAREIWFYQMPWPVSWMGYALEPLYLWMLSKSRAITVSESTRNDLTRFGFNKQKIKIISEGIDIKPVNDIRSIKKFSNPTLLFIGALRKMKRPHHLIRAFELAKKNNPDLQLIIAGTGNGRYYRQVKKQIKQSSYVDDIKFLGPVTDEQKIELLRKAHILLVASVKEGWGLVVTEAASQGTPSIAYDVDGLRDSIRHLKTGMLTDCNTPEGISKAIAYMLSNPLSYVSMQYSGWKWSQYITFAQCYNDFKEEILNMQ